MGKMSLGQMRTLVELRQPTVATDEYGRKKPTYTTAATVLAHINVDTTPRDESRPGGLPQTVTERLIVIHHNASITTEWQVRVGAKDWNIESINDPDGEGEILELHCKQVEG